MINVLVKIHTSCTYNIIIIHVEVADELNYVATSLSTLLLHCVCRITKHL